MSCCDETTARVPPNDVSRRSILKGAAVIAPERIKTNDEPPPVAIEQIVVDDKPVEKTASIELPAGAYRLEFHYTGLSFIAPEKVHFKFRLEGLDQNWVDAGARRMLQGDIWGRAAGLGHVGIHRPAAGYGWGCGRRRRRAAERNSRPGARQ